ncbi:MAG: hypothetical protein GVY26_04300 [Bacteroidetes bacterium]|jgi:hypothetical protein|nr:hypothetical protein [Bacteroidota bacterium]
MIYQESGLEFRFDDSWHVKAYDKHRFYQGLSGMGLSGMDFIGLHAGQLYFFEVKNYRRRQDWQTENPFDQVAAEPDWLATTISKKMADTLTGIDAIGQYYHRKLLFRWTEPWLLSHIPPTWEWAFWARVYALSDEPSHVNTILWLETEQPQRDLRRLLVQQLATRTPGTVRVLGNGANGLKGLQVSPLIVS